MVNAVTQIERLAARRQIAEILRRDGVELVLRRRTKVSAPGGGWKWGAEAPLEPQLMALIPFKRRMTEFLVATELGDVPDLPYTILGAHDLDIEPKDRFTWEGDEYEVQTVDIKQEVRIAAHVDYYGGAKNG